MILELTDNPGTIASLLVEAGLPDADIQQVDWLMMLGYQVNENLVAAGGLERCGKDLLLRSVVVAPQSRGRGLGFQLVNELESRAAKQGYTAIYLLTLDAQRYFAGAPGYRELEREAAPEGIRYSSQFTGICPASATLMVKHI